MGQANCPCSEDDTDNTSKEENYDSKSKTKADCDHDKYIVLEIYDKSDLQRRLSELHEYEKSARNESSDYWSHFLSEDKKDESFDSKRKWKIYISSQEDFDQDSVSNVKSKTKTTKSNNKDELPDGEKKEEKKIEDTLNYHKKPKETKSELRKIQASKGNKPNKVGFNAEKGITNASESHKTNKQLSQHDKSIKKDIKEEDNKSDKTKNTFDGNENVIIVFPNDKKHIEKKYLELKTKKIRVGIFEETEWKKVKQENEPIEKSKDQQNKEPDKKWYEPFDSADIKSKELVEIKSKANLKKDGTVGQKVIYKDEYGRRVDPPSKHVDTHEIYYTMAPPFYSDLGKKANDVFGKGYHFGVIKLDLKTKSESGVEFNSGIVSNQESGKVFGSLQSKYAVKDYGLTFTEKWNTDNTLATDITIQDKIAAGLKITLEGTFAPQTGSKSGKLKTQFSNDTVAVNTNFDLDLAGPIVDVAGVLKYQGWLAGVNTQFDTQKAKFSKNNFALGYATNDFALHTNVDNGKDFGGSIYQKVSDKIDCGVSMKWAAGSADTLFGVGAKFALDQDASLHAKINNKSLIGLGYQQKLRPGVTLTLSAAIDGQNFNAGGHKVGLALELEP